ncbi:hypothetical protein [Marinobacter sp. X15-166B]|uniref:hypothetical protein n=1 Tax=Marinobacter sp. X15-166B TaxID=1897620 RepID=UPI00085BC7B1|nr:hypothetical protein [Marinobacter sp. X15-166B]OEY66753.1 hypothetical protein BG841_10005 [Marinobacter sp. X15-166B]
MNINLHIERLIVDDVGIQPQQSDALTAAVVAALRQQIVAQGVGPGMLSGESRAAVSGGSIAMQHSEGVASLGRQIGDAVYRGIGR